MQYGNQGRDANPDVCWSGSGVRHLAGRSAKHFTTIASFLVYKLPVRRRRQSMGPALKNKRAAAVFVS
jgi:hypothetical protein